MLDEPRALLDRALLPLYPPEPPPKALLFAPVLFGMSRLPMLLLPPLPARLAVLLPPARSLTAAPPRLACCPALACRFAVEPPRAVPPYLLAVA